MSGGCVKFGIHCSTLGFNDIACICELLLCADGAVKQIHYDIACICELLLCADGAVKQIHFCHGCLDSRLTCCFLQFTFERFQSVFGLQTQSVLAYYGWSWGGSPGMGATNIDPLSSVGFESE